MNKKKIFIFEFVSGGGFNQVDIPPSLFCEGYGMLRSIIADFKSLDFEILTLLDYRISFLSNYLETDKIIMVNFEDNYKNKYKESVKECEFCFIIAPEFSNILYDLTKTVRDCKKTLLSVDSKGIDSGFSIKEGLPGVDIQVLKVGNGSNFEGRTLGELELRKKHGVTVLSIRRGSDMVYTPYGDYLLKAKDACVLLGKPEDLFIIRKFFEGVHG